MQQQESAQGSEQAMEQKTGRMFTVCPEFVSNSGINALLAPRPAVAIATNVAFW